MSRISVLTTLYRSEPYIEDLYRRTLDVLNDLGADYEFVFVDDGSPDDSKKLVQGLIEQDENVRLVELSRNFGQHRATMAGLSYANGDYVFLFDSDLEEDPELLRRFYDVMHNSAEEIDVVYGYMEQRRGSLKDRIPGGVFYKLINLMSDLPIPPNPMAARLMTRSYVENLLNFGESHVWLAGIMSLNGFTQVGIPCEKKMKGSSTYSLGRKFALAADALVSFTNKPLTFVACSGLAISSVSFFVALYFFGRVIFGDAELEGWVLVLASLWFLGGLIISAVGLVGFYVGRIFLQVKGRPNAIVRRVYGQRS